MTENHKRWLPIFISLAASTVALTLVFLLPAFSDHLPPELLARGTPERTLAGITLGKSKLSDVMRIYGPPTRQVRAPNNPEWSGYIWEISSSKIEVDFEHERQGDFAHYVYIQGSDKGRLDSTGAGLKLGDDISSLRHIYGPRFQVITSPDVRIGWENAEDFKVSAGGRLIVLQWRSEDFSLVVGISDIGKIVAMQLTVPECYPSGCGH